MQTVLSQSVYSKFIDQVKSAQVQRVVIKPDRIEYSLKPEFGGQHYYTQPSGKTDDLMSLLQSHDIEFTHAETTATPAGLMGMMLSVGML